MGAAIRRLQPGTDEDAMRIVLVNGCFDPLHAGHILHFREARKHGDKLVVAVTEDEFVNKGPKRPFFPLSERMYCISELRLVDDVIAVESSLAALMRVFPSVWALGKDYEGRVRQEDEDWCDENGCEIVFTDSKRYSATRVIDDLSRRR